MKLASLVQIDGAVEVTQSEEVIDNF